MFYYFKSKMINCSVIVITRRNEILDDNYQEIMIYNDNRSAISLHLFIKENDIMKYYFTTIQIETVTRPIYNY